MYWSFLTINPTQWLILAGIFAVFCLFMPKRIPISITAAAFLTGAALFIYKAYSGNAAYVPFQLVIFMGSLVFILFFIRPNALIEPHQFPHRNAVFTLELPIQNGVGTYKHHETTFKLVGPDLPIGAKVTIISIQGTTLYIEPLSQ